MPGPYTAVQDRSTMTLSALKSLLGITGTDQDTALTLWLASAKEDADEWLCNPFWKRDWDEDSDTYEDYLDPVVELAIPQQVELGLVEWVRAQRSMAASNPLLSSEGASSPNGSSWTKGYRTEDLAKPLELVREKFWARYRLKPGF